MTADCLRIPYRHEIPRVRLSSAFKQHFTRTMSFFEAAAILKSIENKDKSIKGLLHESQHGVRYLAL